MRQPLVTRPAYDIAPRATAELPSGSPAGKGVSLDEDVAGYKTFSKPVDDVREPDTGAGSPHRIDGPDSLAKEEDQRAETRWVDDAGTSPSLMGLGDKADDSSITRYPYRDDRPNTHNANAVDPDFVAQLHLLGRAPTVRLAYEARIAARVAATAEQILSGLNPKFVGRAKDVQVTLKRADRKKLRWIFSVRGNHVYAVKVKAMRPRANTTKFSKMDLELSCSCPAWQWQGPEYHATGQKPYQLGPLMGTASAPDVRDPERQNFVCKHMAAVLAMTKNWEVPVK